MQLPHRTRLQRDALTLECPRTARAGAASPNQVRRKESPALVDDPVDAETALFRLTGSARRRRAGVPGEDGGADGDRRQADTERGEGRGVERLIARARVGGRALQIGGMPVGEG